MSNMQETLSFLVTGPTVKENDFDDVQSSVGNNESHYEFNINDYVYFFQDGSEQQIIRDTTDLSENYLDVLLQYVHCNSNDTDSNTVSQELVEEYRNFWLKTLGN